MQNNAMFSEVMASKPSRRDGEAAPDWHAPQMPRVFPKVMLGGLVLVLVSAVLSGPIDRVLEKRRIVAQTAATEEARLQKRMSDFENRANSTARSLETERKQQIAELSAFRESAKDHPDLRQRESFRLALEEIHTPAEAALNTTLDLREKIHKDREIIEKRGSSPAVDAAISEYRAATKVMSEHISDLKASRSRNYRKLILETSTNRRPVSSAPLPNTATAESAQSGRLPNRPELPESVRQAAAPRPTPSPEPAKRQVTDW